MTSLTKQQQELVAQNLPVVHWVICDYMLRRYRKIQLIDEQGAERTLLLSKTAKFQIGARYRFYFQKGSRPAVGNDYLDAALSTNSFLGYEALEDAASCAEDMEQTPHE